MASPELASNVHSMEQHMERMLARIREGQRVFAAMERELQSELYALRLGQDENYRELAAKTAQEERAGVPTDLMDPDEWSKHLADA